MLGLVSVALMLLGYAWMAHRQHQKNPDDTTIPSWSQLGEGIEKIIEINPRSEERWLAIDSQATLERLFLGLLVGVLGAGVIGLLMGCFSSIEAFLLPPMQLLAKIPPTAALAVFFVLVGTETEMYVAMIAFGVLPTLAQATYLAVRDVPDELLYKAYTLGSSRVELIWNVIMRSMLPRLIDAVRLQVGPAMVFLIAAEMVVGDVGFGYRIRLQSRLLNMNVVYPYLAILAVFGLLTDLLMRFFQQITCPWYVREER